MLLRSRFSEIVRSGYNKGFFHILVSSSLVKVVGFLSAMFLPRVLGDKEIFGLLVYVDNIFNYLLIFNALGIANATIRFCAKEDDQAKRKGIFLSITIVGFIVDLIITALWLVFLFFFKPEFPEAKPLLYLMSGIPIFTFLFEDLQMLFRASLRNKEFSLISFGYSFLMLVCQVGFAYLYGIKGVISGRYIAVTASIILACFLLRGLSYYREKIRIPSFAALKRMVRFGVVMMFANSTSYLMQLNEVFLIGYILASPALLADYKVASYILSISLFVTQAMMVVILPYFIKHMDDKKWVWAQFTRIFKINISVMLLIHLGLILIAKYFIIIIFGEKYLSAVPIMIMLLIASFGQAVFRSLPGNILAGIGQERYNLRINIVFLVLHLGIDYFAITYWGIYGAAVGLTIVYYASGLMMVHHLKTVCIREQRV